MYNNLRGHTGELEVDGHAGARPAWKGEDDAPRPVVARLADGSVVHLTGREAQVLELLVEGLSNKQIARTLIISPDTVKAHITRILYKLGAESRTEAAVRWAMRSRD